METLRTLRPFDGLPKGLIMKVDDRKADELLKKRPAIVEIYKPPPAPKTAEVKTPKQKAK